MNTQTELSQDKELAYKKIINNLMRLEHKMPTRIFKTYNKDEALLVSECLNYFLGGSEIKQTDSNNPKPYDQNYEVSSKGYYYYIGS